MNRLSPLSDTDMVGGSDNDSHCSANSFKSSASEDEDILDKEHRLGPVSGKWPFGGKGRTNDVPLPTGKACIMINKLLTRAKIHAGEFTFGGLADSLPCVPGICVNGVGEIPLPLTEEYATKLISKCAKSPFGHNMDTKMDETVRKSWQLEPKQVQFTNPEWQVGLEKLIQTISNRLGYEDVPLQCSLYKVLVYSEGGHFLKHQDTEKEDGMVATLVVQPPSLHKGGDLVVYRGGELMYRHNFGKANATAAFFPHYAVHYADAEHALEEVTSGYRLAFVYSLCLPAKFDHLKQTYDDSFITELSGAISEVASQVDLFTLLLTHEYTAKSIGDLGLHALKGTDRAWFTALEEANCRVSPEKKLQLYIAQLKHKICYGGSDNMRDWEECERKESITWYSTDGTIVGVNTKEDSQYFGGDVYGDGDFNFLNPDLETYAQMWRKYGNSRTEGYTGNEGPSMDTKYSRYAIVAWAGTEDTEKTIKVFGSDAAMTLLETHMRIDASLLRSLVTHVPRKASDAFLHKLSKFLVDVGEAPLVKLFLQTKCCTMNTWEEVPSFIIELVQAFKWDEIGTSFSKLLGSYKKLPQINAALKIVDGSSSGESETNTALLEYAMEKISKLNTKQLGTLSSSKLLWKWILRSNNKSAFEALIQALDKPSQLGKTIAASTSQLSDMDRTDDRFKTITGIVAKRMDWLKGKIQELDQPFSWEMPGARFANDAHIEEFLRGPDISTTTKGFHDFGSFRSATNYAAKYTREKQIGCSFEMEALEGEDGHSFVRIDKTKRWFAVCQKYLQKCKQELEMLNHNYEFENVVASGANKRARLE